VYYGTDEYHLLLMRAGAWEDITSQTANLSSSDEMNTLSVEVSFSINANPLDKYIPKLAVQVGDKIKIMNKDKEIFQGVITEDSLDFTYTAHDFGWYLNKSTLTFQANNAPADSVITQLCSRAGVPLGNVPAMPQKITKLYVGETVSGIMTDVLSQVTTLTGREFLYRVEAGKLWIRDMPGDVVVLKHYPAWNISPYPATWALGKVSGGHSLDDFSNAVQLVNEGDNVAHIVASAENAASIAQFGRVQTTLTVSDDMNGTPAAIVKAALEKADRLPGEFTIAQMYGADIAKSGRVVQFGSDAFGLSGLYRIKSVTHEYGHPHTMSLTVVPVSVPRAGDGVVGIPGGLAIAPPAAPDGGAPGSTATPGTTDTVTGSTTQTVKEMLEAGTNKSDAVSVITTGGGAALVAVAKKEVGTKESPLGSNKQKYGAWFGMNGVRWCAIFVSWCANAAGIPASVMPHGEASVSGFQDWYASRKLFRKKSSGYIPQPGDLMIQKSAGASHVGIVERADSDSFSTIEGNTSNKVGRHTYQYTDAKLTGFCTPKW